MYTSTLNFPREPEFPEEQKFGFMAELLGSCEVGHYTLFKFPGSAY